MKKFIYTATEARMAFNDFRTKRSTIKQMNRLLKQVQKDAESGMSGAVYHFDAEGFALCAIKELQSLGYQVRYTVRYTQYRVEVHW